ncbi:MAG: iron-sulfur cluster assembly scaffold protein [Geminicoccaceae bacterium]
MSQDLYQQALVELAKSGTGAGRLDKADGTATADNPLCGDRVTLDLTLSEGRVDDLAHKTRGCLLTQAAAAWVGCQVPGMGKAEAAALREQVRQWLAGEKEKAPEGFDIMAPVRTVKSRHDCVLIAFEALGEALKQAAGKG